MKYSIDKQEHYNLIQINEDKLDTIVAPELKSEFVKINAEGVKNVVLDLSSVKYIDSSGLSSVLVANRLCDNSNGKLIITGVTDHVMKLLKISQLDSVLTLLKTIEEARDSIFMNEIEQGIKEDED